MENILYLGSDKRGTTSLHRAQALERLGHTVTIKNPYQEIQNFLGTKVSGVIHYRTGYRFVQGKINTWLSRLVKQVEQADLIWVDSGEIFGINAVKTMRQLNAPVLLYNVDDPTGGRDHRRFDSLLKALPAYDFTVTVRKETAKEYRQLGAGNVMRVFRSYDEVAHRPFDDRSDIPEQYRSGVSFIGTWMRGEGRDEFMLALADAGIPVSIWGGRWEKSPHWQRLKTHYRGAALVGRDYVAAIQGAEICIGLLSKGNRDLHTQRSLEIPYAGGLLCAERTVEHQQLYIEGEEAVLWNNVQECAEKCKQLLKNEQQRMQIRQAGMNKVRALNLGNEDVCHKILQQLKQTYGCYDA